MHNSLPLLIRRLAPAVVGLGLMAASPAWADPQKILPTEIWPDNRGEHIQAHGGGIIKLGDTYYWYGEDRTRGADRTKRYVACYSSTDLAHWTYRNQVVKTSDPANLGRGFGRLNSRTMKGRGLVTTG